MYNYDVEILEPGGGSTVFPAPALALEIQIEPGIEFAEVVVEGPQGVPGQDLILLLEAGDNTIPPGTPSGTIVFQKA